MAQRGPKTKWVLEKIKAGFDDFYAKNGRWPTALEIDSHAILPSSRQIQRKWGGLKGLRQLLNLPILDYTSGDIRRDTARFIGTRGKDSEANLQKMLIDRFGEVFVHMEKPFNMRRNYVDFFVYAKNYSFGVDAFYAIGLKSFQGTIRIKQQSYKNTPFDVYFVSMNPDISQIQIETLIKNKKIPFNAKIRVNSLEEFTLAIKNYQPLEKPINCNSAES